MEEDTPERCRDWSALPGVPLDIIAGCLNIIDSLSLRHVCSSWFASPKKKKKIPFLITTSHTNTLSFYDLVRKENIPSTFTVDFQSPGTRFAGCSFGWLALANEDPVREKVIVTLLNPFTSSSIELSELTGLRLFGGRVLLSGSPANLQQPPIVVYHSRYPSRLQFQKVGDGGWKTINQHTSSLTEVVACNGRFYCFDSSNILYLVDLQADNGDGAVVQLQLDLPDIFFGVPPPRWEFLAKVSGDLVVMFFDQHGSQIFLKVDLENDRLVIMPNMSDCLLFQSQSCSFSVPGDQRSLHFQHDGRHIVHSGFPNHVIIIYARYWRHPDPRIRWRALPLGWINPDLNR